MRRRSTVLRLLAAAIGLGLAGWMVASRRSDTYAPTTGIGSDAPHPPSPAVPNPSIESVEPRPTESLRRESAAPPSTNTAIEHGPEPDPADQALLDELWAMRDREPIKVYEVLQQRFARDAGGTARLCELAVIEAAANEVILTDEPFFGAVFAAWLDATSSPHAVLTAVLAVVPGDMIDLLPGPLQSLSHCLAKRHEHLPPQPEGQQRALVHALVAAADRHRDRLVSGLLVARALGYAVDHDPMAQAALVHLARSTEPRIQEAAWAALAAELAPSAFLPVIDEPLLSEPHNHDAARVCAALASIRNAPEQRDVIDRWLGARLLELARQSQTSTDPNRYGARWLTVVREHLSEDDRKALLPELQTLAAGQGNVARFARHLLQAR